MPSSAPIAIGAVRVSAASPFMSVGSNGCSRNSSPASGGGGEIAPRGLVGEAAIGVRAERHVRPQHLADAERRGDLFGQRLDARP